MLWSGLQNSNVFLIVIVIRIWYSQFCDALKDIIFAIGFNYIKCWKTCSVYVEGNLAAIVKQLTMNTKKCSFSKSSSSSNIYCKQIKSI